MSWNPSVTSKNGDKTTSLPFNAPTRVTQYNGRSAAELKKKVNKNIDETKKLLAARDYYRESAQELQKLEAKEEVLRKDVAALQQRSIAPLPKEVAALQQRHNVLQQKRAEIAVRDAYIYRHLPADAQKAIETVEQGHDNKTNVQPDEKKPKGGKVNSINQQVKAINPLQVKSKEVKQKKLDPKPKHESNAKAKEAAKSIKPAKAESEAKKSQESHVNETTDYTKGFARIVDKHEEAVKDNRFENCADEFKSLADDFNALLLTEQSQGSGLTFGHPTQSTSKTEKSDAKVQTDQPSKADAIKSNEPTASERAGHQKAAGPAERITQRRR